MSELMPEVGDVWINNYRKLNCIILNKEDNYILYLCCYIASNGLDFFTETCFDDEYFLSRHKYLGKSKANINQLFEVEDDNR